MNEKKLRKARRKIDKLDQSIFYLIKKRTVVINDMMGLKKYNQMYLQVCFQ